jgi:hypothetical protein
MTAATADLGQVWTDDTIRRQAARMYRSALGLTRNAAPRRARSSGLYW